jgi:hypothetical protein
MGIRPMVSQRLKRMQSARFVLEMQRLGADGGNRDQAFEELRHYTEHFQKAIVDEAIVAAEDAAALVIKASVVAAAPRKTGKLAEQNQKTISAANRSGRLSAFSGRISTSIRVSL